MQNIRINDIWNCNVTNLSIKQPEYLEYLGCLEYLEYLEYHVRMIYKSTNWIIIKMNKLSNIFNIESTKIDWKIYWFVFSDSNQIFFLNKKN